MSFVPRSGSWPSCAWDGHNGIVGNRQDFGCHRADHRPKRAPGRPQTKAALTLGRLQRRVGRNRAISADIAGRNMLGCDADVPEVCSPAKGADPHPIDMFLAAMSLVSMKELQKAKGHHDVGFCGKTEPAGSAPKEIPAVPPVRISSGARVGEDLEPERAVV